MVLLLDKMKEAWLMVVMLVVLNIWMNFHQEVDAAGDNSKYYILRDMKPRVPTLLKKWPKFFMGKYFMEYPTPRPILNPLIEDTSIKIAWNSTCSFRTSQRGTGQKVVSFCFFGPVNTKEKYFEGIEINAKVLQTYYPGWLMRVYHDVSPSNNKLSKTFLLLQEKNTFMDFCYIGDIPTYGNLAGSEKTIWRFLPLADPLVDIFVSRDLDSQLNQREALAVQHWLDSRLPFHTMRDHPSHNVTLLAGMWGAVTKTEHLRMLNFWMEILAQGKVPGSKYLDQEILLEVVWPKIKGEVMQHDSYHCESFRSHGNMNPWPSRRLLTPYNFVGSPFGNYDPMLSTCPEKCRPLDHEDWVNC